MSIDIDGNDYWVWDAISVTSAKAVIIETHTEFGLKNIVVPYDKDYVYPGRHPDYHGASPVAMEKLARRKGYRLIGANRLGFNTIYLREGLAPNYQLSPWRASSRTPATRSARSYSSQSRIGNTSRGTRDSPLRVQIAQLLFGLCKQKRFVLRLPFGQRRTSIVWSCCRSLLPYQGYETYKL